MKRDMLAELSRAFLDDMPQEMREAWEERAAIMEYDSILTRQEAETAAYKDCKNMVRGK